MTEISSQGMRVPLDRQPRHLRVLGFLQMISSIVTIIVGLILGFAMFYYFAPIGVIICVVGFIYCGIGLALSGNIPRGEKSTRRILLYINSIWIVLLITALLITAISTGAIFGNSEISSSLLQYFIVGLVLPLIIILQLMDTNIKSDFI
ncbi:MAG: hypothetical protein ACFFCP_11400 [Promethearchaeota archaeon]